MKITRLSKKAFGNDFLVAAGCCCNCNTCTTCCWGWFESESSISAQYFLSLEGTNSPPIF